MFALTSIKGIGRRRFANIVCKKADVANMDLPVVSILNCLFLLPKEHVRLYLYQRYIGRRFANIVCKKADVDMNKRTGEISAAGLQNMMTVVASPRQFKIPDWFSNVSKYTERVASKHASIVEVLLGTYEAIFPGHRVFDLLLQVYSKKRMVNEAFDACRYLGDHGMDANIISFNTMLHVSQRSDQNNLAWKIFEYMFLVSVLDRIHGSRCAPGIIVNTTLVFRIIEEDRAEETITLLKRMLQRNMMFDDIAYSLIEERIDEAVQMMEEMSSIGLKPYDETYYHLIIDTLHSIVETNRTLTSLLIMGLVPDQEIYLILIDGYGTTGDYQKIITLYYEMVHMGLEPNVNSTSPWFKTSANVDK
ncbi:hypothetical protein ZIOFF_022503 [Zingiber officinale]|uniref:Pentatricopeptide repeat-containing protein n=1 Tax=Zingiber officinale TaxID=94328 RepID=A0A8J5H990_ZINOF|nr:hypothetical protein ZIOFF_022503 [Zingiber officinale]